MNLREMREMDQAEALKNFDFVAEATDLLHEAQADTSLWPYKIMTDQSVETKGFNKVSAEVVQIADGASGLPRRNLNAHEKAALTAKRDAQAKLDSQLLTVANIGPAPFHQEQGFLNFTLSKEFVEAAVPQHSAYIPPDLDPIPLPAAVPQARLPANPNWEALVGEGSNWNQQATDAEYQERKEAKLAEWDQEWETNWRAYQDAELESANNYTEKKAELHRLHERVKLEARELNEIANATYQARKNDAFHRAIERDEACATALSNVTTHTDTLRKRMLGADEQVIAQLSVIGFLGAPKTMSGMLGHGVMMLTELPDTEIEETVWTEERETIGPDLDEEGADDADDRGEDTETPDLKSPQGFMSTVRSPKKPTRKPKKGNEASEAKQGSTTIKRMVPKVVKRVKKNKRLHFLIQQDSGYFSFKESSEMHKTVDLEVQDRSDLTSTVQVDEMGAHIANIYRSDRRIDGKYLVMRAENVFYHAHCEWQDTSKLSSFFEASKEHSAKTESFEPIAAAKPRVSRPRPLEYTAAVQDQDCLSCLPACGLPKCPRCPTCPKCPSCSLAQCCSWCREMCITPGSEEVITAGEEASIAPSKPTTQAMRPGNARMAAREQKQVAGEADFSPRLEKFLERYSTERSASSVAPNLVMSRGDAETDGYDSLAGTEMTRHSIKQLRTMNFVFRSPSKFWYDGDFAPCTAVIDPNMPTEHLIEFASIFEHLTLKDAEDRPDEIPLNFHSPLEAKLEPPGRFEVTNTDVMYKVTGDSAILERMTDAAKKAPWSSLPGSSALIPINLKRDSQNSEWKKKLARVKADDARGGAYTGTRNQLTVMNTYSAASDRDKALAGASQSRPTGFASFGKSAPEQVREPAAKVNAPKATTPKSGGMASASPATADEAVALSTRLYRNFNWLTAV